MTLDLPPSSASGDSTEFPAAEQLLRSFHLWAETSRELIAELTLEGRIVCISPNVRAVLGYEAPEVVGLSLLANVHPQDLPRVRDRLVAPQGWGTFRYRHQDGSWLWIECSARRFVNPEGEDRIWLLARDVTGRKWAEDDRQQVEAQLRQVQKLETLGSLAAGIAHDFSNIVAATVLNAELLRIETAGQPKVQARLDQILSANLRAKDLVRQISDFSRPHAEKRQPTSFPGIISEVFGLLRVTLPKVVELRADVRDTSSLVLADGTQIHQVLMNLCLNAAQAMPEQTGGRIDVRLDSFFADANYSRARPSLREGAYVRLTITDNGAGMTPETRERMFEPFFTTKGNTEGTGLGLTVVRRIIDLHQGVIHVASEVGRGTVVELLFPRYEARAIPPAS